MWKHVFVKWALQTFWGGTPVRDVLWTWELGDPPHSRMPCGGPLRGDVTHTVEGKDSGPNGHQFPPLQCFSEPVMCCCALRLPKRTAWCAGRVCLTSQTLEYTAPNTHTHTPHPCGPAFADPLWEMLSPCGSSYVQNPSALSSAQACQASRWKTWSI